MLSKSLVILNPYVVGFNAAVAFSLGFDILFKLWSTNVQNQENYVKKENNQEEEEIEALFSFSSNL